MMMEIKLFNRWSTKGIKVQDEGLRKYINLEPRIIPRSTGRRAGDQFHKSSMSIVERLVNKMMVPGHRGKKHVLTSGRSVGKMINEYKIVRKVFEKIEQVTQKNPVEVLVRAIENAARREEIAAYQMGGIIVRRAVITSPQRRVDLALKDIVQTSYRKSFAKKEDMVGALSNEIIAAYYNDASKSEAIRERGRIEKEAEGAR